MGYNAKNGYKISEQLCLIKKWQMLMLTEVKKTHINKMPCVSLDVVTLSFLWLNAWSNLKEDGFSLDCGLSRCRRNTAGVCTVVGALDWTWLQKEWCWRTARLPHLPMSKESRKQKETCSLCSTTSNDPHKIVPNSTSGWRSTTEIYKPVEVHFPPNPLQCITHRLTRKPKCTST